MIFKVNNHEIQIRTLGGFLIGTLIFLHMKDDKSGKR